MKIAQSVTVVFLVQAVTQALSSFSCLFLIIWWKLGNSLLQHPYLRRRFPRLHAWIGFCLTRPFAFDKSVRQIRERNLCASLRACSTSLHSISSQFLSLFEVLYICSDLGGGNGNIEEECTKVSK